ncbi:tRNA pseudouridine(38-40) synthase TruA [Actinomadura livida]|uniref:tRNA pseudouridine synthase A n=1 Tax=Actinomadura livida TaxID=79909 RepID=A0A7W7IJD8_9ACTN|nr:MULTISPECIES: tRNA pseudouridine(38-40) synthase TruA [Actinomadura]MBB4778194.1 tRNA pseudouridine38-40 synthase [Actinomadura catellatispora]GGU29448.1 tRNA pseudouridine synthase A [Actinomadura livida]
MTALVRLRLDIGYDGSDFAGWARQPNQRTVQGVIEDALARMLRLDPPPMLTVAGRTDAGVHARGQVAHLVVPVAAYSAINGTMPRRLAGLLPPDVRVWRVSVAPEGFDARFSALSRRYVYRVCDNPVGVEPLRRHDVLWHPRPLDLQRMNEAARLLVGENDFAAYCRKREGATTIRELLRYEWARDDRDPYLALATVEADAFCHSMVRALVGALLMVGDGRREVEWPAQVLAARVRDSAVNVAPAHGLSLEEIRYPGDDGLARRAQETRRVRTLAASTSASGTEPPPALPQPEASQSGDRGAR